MERLFSSAPTNKSSNRSSHLNVRKWPGTAPPPAFTAQSWSTLAPTDPEDAEGKRGCLNQPSGTARCCRQSADHLRTRQRSRSHHPHAEIQGKHPCQTRRAGIRAQRRWGLPRPPFPQMTQKCTLASAAANICASSCRPQTRPSCGQSPSHRCLVLAC